MSTAPAAVTRTISLDLIDDSGAATPLQAELRYHTDDPYAVTALFRAGPTMVRWVFARDLLATGIHEPAGDGDVHVWPCLDTPGASLVALELCSPNGEAVLQLRSHDVEDFLDRTYDLVPVGSESAWVDLDAVLADLLASG